jgi:hypothetical protein
LPYSLYASTIILLGLLTGAKSFEYATLPHHSYIVYSLLDFQVIFGLIKILNASASFAFLKTVVLSSVTNILSLIQICGAAIQIRLLALIVSTRSLMSFFIFGDCTFCIVFDFLERIGFHI